MSLVGLGLAKLFTRLRNLRVEIGRVDRRKQLAFLDVIADIDKSLAQITISPCIDVSDSQRAGGSRHGQLARSARAHRLHDLYLRLLILAKSCGLRGFLRVTVMRQPSKKEDGQHHDNADRFIFKAAIFVVFLTVFLVYLAVPFGPFAVFAWILTDSGFIEAFFTLQQTPSMATVPMTGKIAAANSLKRFPENPSFLKTL